MPTSISENDKLLLRVIDDSWQETKEISGKLLACRPGCIECCYGPFAINQLDAWRLREGVKALNWVKSTAVRLRAAGAWRRMRQHFPGDPETGILDDEGDVEGFGARYAKEPCPALDPRTETCDLYEHRPMVCRTFGPPTSVQGERMPHCHLCYRGASPVKIEECRMEVDPERMEDAILIDIEEEGPAYGQTVIAFVLK